MSCFQIYTILKTRKPVYLHFLSIYFGEQNDTCFQNISSYMCRSCIFETVYKLFVGHLHISIHNHTRGEIWKLLVWRKEALVYLSSTNNFYKSMILLSFPCKIIKALGIRTTPRQIFPRWAFPQKTFTRRTVPRQWVLWWIVPRNTVPQTYNSLNEHFPDG